MGFYLSWALSPNTLDVLGAYVSPIQDSCPPPYWNKALSQCKPQVVNPKGNCLNDSVNWALISGSFTAKGGEEYLTLGVFADDTNVTYCLIWPGAPSWHRADYFVDDVFLYKCSDPRYPADAGNDTLICMGDSLQLGNNNFEDYYYQWKGGGILQDSVGMPWVRPLATTTYYLTQQDFAFHITRDSVVVTVKNCEPPAMAGNDTTICMGDSTLLGNTGCGDCLYTWEDDTGVIATSSTVLAKPQAKTQYRITQTDRFGFSTSDSVWIDVEDCNKPLTIPNVFTPNGDGKNDSFEIINPGNYKLQITIFNRWGTLVFNSNDGKFWDGKINNAQASGGVYFYSVTATTHGGRTIPYQGMVTVVY